MDLHNAIMNLPSPRLPTYILSESEVKAYKYGFRDARHAAAELVTKQEAMCNPLVDRLALLDRINDLMTAGGATLTEYQSNVLYGAIKALDLRTTRAV